MTMTSRQITAEFHELQQKIPNFLRGDYHIWVRRQFAYVSWRWWSNFKSIASSAIGKSRSGLASGVSWLAISYVIRWWRGIQNLDMKTFCIYKKCSWPKGKWKFSLFYQLLSWFMTDYFWSEDWPHRLHRHGSRWHKKISDVSMNSVIKYWSIVYRFLFPYTLYMHFLSSCFLPISLHREHSWAKTVQYFLIKFSPDV
jgi:hypothetical protein